MSSTKITGKQYGLLIVLDEYRNEKGYLVCLCKCECGNVKTIHKSNLTAGRTKSCGCLEEENRRKINDLCSKKFGRLTVITPTDQRKHGNVVWECICDCGETVYVTGRHLTRGETKSCGCIVKEKHEISNKRYGKLTTLYPDTTSKCGRQKWICRCECGTVCSVFASNLKNGHTKSCGCLHDLEYRTMVEGTCLELIASDKVSSNSKSGVRGVSYRSKTDSWVATICLQKRRYFLGEYAEISEAAHARKLAEKILFEPVVEKYRHLLKTKQFWNQSN